MKHKQFQSMGLLVALFVFIGLALPACADGQSCDADTMERDRNYCVLKGAGGAQPEAPEPAPPNDDFGVVCTDDSDCGAGAPLCGKAPGAEDGICTVSGCDSESETVVCPLGWSCRSETREARQRFLQVSAASESLPRVRAFDLKERARKSIAPGKQQTMTSSRSQPFER
jgi:hypothetical protein